MSGTVIRDAVIRIALETKGRFEDMFDGGTAAKSLEDFKKRAQEATAEIDKLKAAINSASNSGGFGGGIWKDVDEYERRMASEGRTSKPRKPAGMSDMDREHSERVKAMRDAQKKDRAERLKVQNEDIAFDKSLAKLWDNHVNPKGHGGMFGMNADPIMRGLHHAMVTGSPRAGLHFAANTWLNQAAGGMGVGALSAGAGALGGLAVAAAALNEAFTKITANTQRYDRMLAQMAESASKSAFGRAGISAHGDLERIRANQDTIHQATAPAREQVKAFREAQIRIAQQQIAHRPLEEQQAIRQRMEALGNMQDQGVEHAGHMAHFNQQAEELHASRAKSRKQLANALTIEGAAQGDRWKAVQAMQPTGFGGLLSSVIGATPFNNSWIDSLGFGVVGASGAEKGQNDLAQEGKRGQIDALKEQQSLQQTIKQSAEEELEIEKQKSAAAEQRLGVLRETVAATRAAAEAAREGERSKERSFGAASPGTQARLRRIQEKADRGEELTHNERALATQYHIDAEDEANAQNEAIANSPENAGLFKKGRQRVKDAEQAQQVAEGAQANEQGALIQQLDESNKSISALKKEIGESAKGLTDVAQELHSLAEALQELVRAGQLMAEKRRGIVG